MRQGVCKEVCAKVCLRRCLWEVVRVRTNLWVRLCVWGHKSMRLWRRVSKSECSLTNFLLCFYQLIFCIKRQRHDKRSNRHWLEMPWKSFLVRISFRTNEENHFLIKSIFGFHLGWLLSKPPQRPEFIENPFCKIIQFYLFTLFWACYLLKSAIKWSNKHTSTDIWFFCQNWDSKPWPSERELAWRLQFSWAPQKHQAQGSDVE